MADKLTPLLKSLIALIPPEERDQAFALAGHWWVSNSPSRLRRRKRGFSKRRSGAIMQLLASIDVPLSIAPEGETANERRVRIINDALQRCRMFDAAGMKFKTPDGKLDSWYVQRGLERMLIDARIDVRSERKDY